jgi:hypothetical protein
MTFGWSIADAIRDSRRKRSRNRSSREWLYGLAVSLPVDKDRDEDELLHSDQEQAEVVRPKKRGGGKDVSRPVEHRAVTYRSQLRQQSEKAEERHELVHPHLLRVPDEHRRDGGERGRDQTCTAVVQLSSQLVERRYHERPRDQRGEPDGKLAVAEHTDGQPERQVV